MFGPFRGRASRRTPDEGVLGKGAGRQTHALLRSFESVSRLHTSGRTIRKSWVSTMFSSNARPCALWVGGASELVVVLLFVRSLHHHQKVNPHSSVEHDVRAPHT